jgi:hypothetical protein
MRLGDIRLRRRDIAGARRPGGSWRRPLRGRFDDEELPGRRVHLDDAGLADAADVDHDDPAELSGHDPEGPVERRGLLGVEPEPWRQRVDR